MDEQETIDKIKTLTQQLQQRDSELSLLKKQLLNLRTYDKNSEKQGKQVSQTFDQLDMEKEFQKRLNEELAKQEKKHIHKIFDLQVKFDKDYLTLKQMYESVQTKAESVTAHERTIEAMTRDVKILEDEKKNMKLLHMDILKQNQIEFEIKLTDAKKKMVEEIKKVQHNVSHLYLEQLDTSQKLTFLRNTQLEKEIDFRSVRMEELILKNEKFQEKIFFLQEELDNTKNALTKTINKNKKLGEITRKLTDQLTKSLKEKDKEFEKLLILCDIDKKEYNEIINKNNSKNKNDNFTRKSNLIEKINNKEYYKKISLNKKNQVNFNSNNYDDNSNLSVNDNNREYKITKKSSKYLGLNIIKENEDKNENRNENYLYDDISYQTDLYQNKEILNDNLDIKYEISPKDELEKLIYPNNTNNTNNDNIVSKNSHTNRENIQSSDICTEYNPSDNERVNILKEKPRIILNKEYGLDFRNIELPHMNRLQIKSNLFLNKNNNNIRSSNNNILYNINPLRNRDFISGKDLVNGVFFNNKDSNIINFHNIENNNSSNNNINKNKDNNLNSTQINPLINCINKSINYNSNRVSGFNRDNNLYKIYEKRIKELESSLREKEKEYFQLKILFDDIDEKLLNYKKKSNGIISLYETGLKKLLEEEENLKNFNIVDIKFDFSTLISFEFNKLSIENKFNLLIILLNQIIPLVDINELESDFIKQNISMFKMKFYEEKLKCSTSKDTFFRSSVSNHSTVKQIKEGKNPINYINKTSRNVNFNSNSVGNIISKFKNPLNYLKEEKNNLNRKLHMYDYQVID